MRENTAVFLMTVLWWKAKHRWKSTKRLKMADGTIIPSKGLERDDTVGDIKAEGEFRGERGFYRSYCTTFRRKIKLCIVEQAGSRDSRTP